MNAFLFGEGISPFRYATVEMTWMRSWLEKGFLHFATLRSKWHECVLGWRRDFFTLPTEDSVVRSKWHGL